MTLGKTLQAVTLGETLCELRDRRIDGGVGSCRGARGPCPGDQQGEAVLWRCDRLRRAAELAGELRRCGVSRDAAGDQPRMRGTGGAYWSGVECAYSYGQPVRSEELLLCR